jgi:hypothetical protein
MEFRLSYYCIKLFLKLTLKEIFIIFLLNLFLILTFYFEKKIGYYLVPFLFLSYYKIFYFRKVDKLYGLKMFFKLLPIKSINIVISKLFVEYIFLSLQNIIVLFLFLKIKIINVIIFSLILSLFVIVFRIVINYLFLNNAYDS